MEANSYPCCPAKGDLLEPRKQFPTTPRADGTESGSHLEVAWEGAGPFPT